MSDVPPPNDAAQTEPPRTEIGRSIDSLVEHEREARHTIVDRIRSIRHGGLPGTKVDLHAKFRHGKEDALAGVTSAVANVPSDLTSGVLAGINPVYGLYTLMVGLPVAAIFTSTRAMMFDATSAMTLVAVAGLGGYEGDNRVQAIFTIALIAGAVQIALGALGLGFLTRFVSNAVMTGFLTGIAVLIILGQLWDLTGYEGEGGSKLEQTAQLLGHLADIDIWTSIIGCGSLLLMFALDRTPLRSFNLLIALAVATIAAQLHWFDSVPLVKSLGEIPRSLPTPELPELHTIPKLALTGVAVAVVGLLQAAGVAQRYPNPGGADADDSRDFMAQGIANVACGFFQGMPGGGSLSGTALNQAAGARTRLSLFIQAVFVIVLVLVFSDLLSLIPMASLAAILIYSAVLAIKPSSISTVMSTTHSSSLTLMVTFVATLLVPLQQAVVLGIILAAVLYIYRSSTEARVVELRRIDGHITESDPPDRLPDHEVTVLDTYGSLFYAGARTLSQQLPKTDGVKRAFVVLRIRGHGDLGSTFLGVAGRYADQLRANGGALLLSGVDPAVKQRMARSGHLRAIGEANVFVASEARGVSSDEAISAAQALLNQAEAA
jgi:SulP family sulfate permease